jgi:hypothetical protein
LLERLRAPEYLQDFVASRFLGALPPVDFLAVCFVRAILLYFLTVFLGRISLPLTLADAPAFLRCMFLFVVCVRSHPSNLSESTVLSERSPFLFSFFESNLTVLAFDTKEDVSWREEFDGKCQQEFAG